MKTLREYVGEAAGADYAIGHFNVATLEMFHGVVAASEEYEVPVIIGVSEGERDFMGLTEIVALVQALRAEGRPIFLNADHTYSVERVKEAIDAGFDSVIFDGAKLSLPDNIAQSKECVDYARSVNSETLVEGELGYIGSGSTLLDTLPEGAGITKELMTKPEEALEYVKASGIDLLAPAVGNIHGMLKGAPNPNLDISLIAELYQTGGVPMVLHGGSGISDEDLRAGVAAGMGIVHVSTEIRVAARAALEESLSARTDELAPYRYLSPVVEGVKKVVKEHLKLITPSLSSKE